MKKILLLLGVATVISFSIFLLNNPIEMSGAVAQAPTREDAEGFSEEFMENHDRSAQAFEHMRANSPADSEGVVQYPEFYGGAYIDDNGKLVVHVVDVVSGKEGLELATEKFGTSDLTVREAQFSLNELNDMMNFIDEFVFQNPSHEIVSQMSSWYVDEMNNRVGVILVNVDDEMKELFKRDVTNSEMIVFTEGEMITFGSVGRFDVYHYDDEEN